MHQTIKKVGADIESLKMNTAIAQLMTLVNALYDNGGATKAELETVVQLLNPFAPHMTEELWEKLGHSHDEQLAYYPWPKYEEAKCVESYCGDRCAGERQGEGPPEGGCRHRPPLPPLPPPRQTPLWLPRWKASSWSRRSTSRAVWSIWLSRAENCCSAE